MLNFKRVFWIGAKMMEADSQMLRAVQPPIKYFVSLFEGHIPGSSTS